MDMHITDSHPQQTRGRVQAVQAMHVVKEHVMPLLDASMLLFLLFLVAETYCNGILLYE